MASDCNSVSPMHFKDWIKWWELWVESDRCQARSKSITGVIMSADRWKFTEAELLSKRLECNNSVRQRLLSHGSNYSLTTADERCILLYYHQKINDICKYFKFPITTVLTSHLIFSRVHIHKPVVDTSFDLKHIMLASVYLASKINELHTSVESFCAKVPDTERKSIEELEFILLDWLDFEIFFDLPVAPLLAFLLEIHDASYDESVYATCAQTIISMYMTDIPHIFNSSVIALTALKQTSLKLEDPKFDEYLEKLELHSNIQLGPVIDDILSLSRAQSTTFDARYLKEIDSKMNECRKFLLNH